MTDRATVLRPDGIARVARGGGVETVPLVRGDAGAGSFLNGITILPPGKGVPRHWHNCDESVVVLAGGVMLEVDGEEFPMDPTDASFIPAGVPHRFRNASGEAPASILWIYGSRDADRTIEETGETRRIDVEHGSDRTA